ncbi:MAG: BREX system P-loop protein BrxC [Anaerolineales bacterium]|nr:BREX system P-loop protein BrxC [Anaerolineales bacterium]
MNTIGELLSRDLKQPIEEVIKVDQQDERTVYQEINEYVVTDRLLEQYRELLQAIADGPGDPNEAVGVWISGFFGSGKSSFAKNIGYILGNRPVLGKPAAELFVRRLRQQRPADAQVDRIASLVEYVKVRTPTHVIMFDVQKDRRGSEQLGEIMYSLLLRELDYATDHDLAEIEIELEGEGRLGALVEACAALYRDQVPLPDRASIVPETLSGIAPEDYGVWQMVRKGAQSIPRASAALHQIDPVTYPTAEAGIEALRRNKQVTVRELVDRTFVLAARRVPKKTVAYVIDEVGQYIARSGERIENLRAIVEAFGQESRNRVLTRQALAPVWIMVTSQEKLDEVVAAIDDKRVELARLQDRFYHRIDMVPADIREVASRRVLSKTPAGEERLREIFDDVHGRLQTHTQLEGTGRPSRVGEDAFVQHYPYLPHYIDLSIDIVSGLRLQADSPRHIGGSNRTIIKQTYEMLVSPRTELADQPVGTLVTLDRIYDLVENNLSSEKQRDISDIATRWPADPWPARTAKAIALLEPVRDLPRSPENLAALLYDRVDGSSCEPQVRQALDLLEQHQFIRQSEQGWKLQTAQEKSWTTERNAKTPSPRERNEILEDVLEQIWSDTSLSRYRQGNRTFRLGVRWGSRPLTRGESEVPLLLRISDDANAFEAECETARDESRGDHRDEVFWVFSLNNPLDEQVVELHRSREMINLYEQARARNEISGPEATSLTDEKSRALRVEDRLREQVRKALAQGNGYFRGVERQSAALGANLTEIVRNLMAEVVPDLYEKLEMGARPLRGNEPELILKAANLRGLPRVFYQPPDGLELIRMEDDKPVVNTQAPIAQEVLQYLQGQHSYGNKVTGRTLEEHFGGLGYGWERDMLMLVMATLLRAGVVQVTYQGRQFRSHLDPGAQAPFSGTNAFRSASYAPRKAPDLMTLVQAVRRYEDLTGEEIDVDEATIAQAFRALAESELEALLPVEAKVRAHAIPIEDELREYHQWLEAISHSASDDCVNILAGEGQSFQEARERVSEVRRAVDDEGLARLQRMRQVVQRVWPAIQSEQPGDGLREQVDLLQEHLANGTFYHKTPAIDDAMEEIEGRYREIYTQRHAERQQTYEHAIEQIKGQADYAALSESVREDLVRPLEAKAHDLSLDDGTLTCDACRAGLSEMAADLAAVETLLSNALLRLHELSAPEEQVERIRVRDVVGPGRSIHTLEELEETLIELKAQVRRLLDAGVNVILE